jgi:hypothetical protein
MSVSEPAEVAVCAGLEQIRHAERLRISRTLHDQIGPSLCSAGLMVSLLRSGSGGTPPMAQDMLDAIQDALETAIESVRSLSYSADPALAQRCGLRGALEFLARSHRAELDLRAGLPPWPAPRAESACRILQDVLLLAAGPAAARLETTASGLSLAGALDLPGEARTALAALAAQAGLQLDWAAEAVPARLSLHAAPEETS